MADEVQKLILLVQGQEKLLQLKKDLEAEQEVLRTGIELYESLGYTQGQIFTKMQAQASKVVDLNKQIASVSKSTRGWQQNITGLSYAANDFFGVSGDFSQRLNAIANNLPMLLSGFGGLGLILSGIVPIVGMLIRNFVPFMESLKNGEVVKSFADTLDGLKKSLEQLEKKKLKVDADYTAIDTFKEKIDDAKKRLDAFEAAKSGQTTTQRAVSQGAKENLSENAGGTDEQSGTENLQKALAKHDRNRFLGGAEGLINQRETTQSALDEAKELLKSAENDPNAEPGSAEMHRESVRQLEAELAKLKAETDEHVKAKIAQMLGGYANGIDAERQKLAEIIDNDPNGYAGEGIGPQFRANLIGGSAANIRATKKEEQAQGRDKRGRTLEKERTDRALKPVQQFDQMGPAAAGMAFDADTQVGAGTMTREQAFAAVNSGVKAALEEKLRAKNIEPDKKAVEAQAEAIARKALADAERQRTEREQRKQAEGIGQAVQGAQQVAEQQPEGAFGELPAGPQGGAAGPVARGPIRQAGAGPVRPAAPGMMAAAPAAAPAPAAGEDDQAAAEQPAEQRGAALRRPKLADPRDAREAAQQRAQAQGLGAGAQRAAGSQAYREALKTTKETKGTRKIFADARKKQAAAARRKRKSPFAAGQQGVTLGPQRAAAAPAAPAPAGPQGARPAPPPEVQRFISRNEVNQLQMAAMIEQLAGWFGPASARLEQIGQAQQQQFRNATTTSYSHLPASY